MLSWRWVAFSPLPSTQYYSWMRAQRTPGLKKIQFRETIQGRKRCRAWPRYCRKVYWTKMVQNGPNDHSGQNALIPNWILILAFARPKWTKMVHFCPFWPKEVHFGPFRSANLTLAIPEGVHHRRGDRPFCLFPGLGLYGVYPSFRAYGVYPFPLFSQEIGIHHSFFLLCDLGVGRQTEKQGSHSGGVKA